MLDGHRGRARRRRFRLVLLAIPAVGAITLGVPQAGAVPVAQATKFDTLVVDVNSNGVANAGDTLRYTVLITNAGDMDALNVQFSDTIDLNTTLVSGSVKTTPLARHDSYSTVGNVQLSVPASGVLNNDSDPDGTGGLTVTTFSATSTNGGNVSVAADGSFLYNPPPGFSGTDTFNYTVNDGEGNTDAATVSITVGQVVWFIDNAAGGAGDGRFTSPFSSIANFNALAADDPGDYIFLYQGSGAYSGSLTLLNSQQLIGHGVGLTIAPNLSIAAATRPTIANVTLASGNTVRGLNSSTSSGTSISGASVGALMINNVSVTSASGGTGAVSIGGGSAAMAVTFDSVSANGGTNGIALTNNSGSFTVNGGTIQSTTGDGIQLFNTSGSLNFALQNSTVSLAGAGITIAAGDPVPNNGVGPTMQGNISGNTITLNPASPGIGISVVSDGDGNITTNIANNNVTGFGDRGIDVESRGGTGDVHARIANNFASTTASFPLAGMYLRSGATSGDTSLLCANVSSNDMNGGPGAVADYYLARPNPTSAVFQIQGLSPASATAAQAQAYVASTDSAPPATAFAATGTYTAAICNTVSFASPHDSPQHLTAGSPAARPASRANATADRGGATASPASGETVALNLDTLNSGQQIVITFDVTINDPFPAGPMQVCNQGTVSGSNLTTVLTDDPTVAGSADPTCTPVGSPTAARLVSAAATRTRAGAVVRWRTAAEVGSLGFEVYRVRGRERVRLGRGLIPAVAGPGGHTYVIVDRRVGRRPAGFRVVAVALDGTRSVLATVPLRQN
jgi:uncharacterized repeat protein (TIGR01451 family)